MFHGLHLIFCESLCTQFLNNSFKMRVLIKRQFVYERHEQKRTVIEKIFDAHIQYMIYG